MPCANLQILGKDMASATDLEFNKVLSSASRTRWSGCLPGRKSWQAFVTVSWLIFFQRIGESLTEACHIAFVCIETLLPSASTHYYRLRQRIAIVCVDTQLSSAITHCYCLRRQIAIVVVDTIPSLASTQGYRVGRYNSIVSVDTFLLSHTSASTHF